MLCVGYCIAGGFRFFLQHKEDDGTTNEYEAGFFNDGGIEICL